MKQRTLFSPFSIIILAVAACLLAVFATYAASAATTDESDLRESITLSPVSKDYSLKAGDTVTGELTVVNDGQVEYDFIVYAQPYSVSNLTYDPNFTDSKEQSDAYKWVTFDKAEWHIEAGETVKIPYTMTVPENAAQGGHYGVLFAETQPADPGDTAVARKKRVGSILYATVDGKVIMQGGVTSWKIPGFLSVPPVTTKAVVENTGNTHFRTSNVLRVKDVFGNVKFQMDRQYYVLPDTTREIAMNWDGAAKFGLYRVEMTTSFLDKTEAKSGYVLIAPYWLFAVLALALVGGGWYAYSRRR